MLFRLSLVTTCLAVFAVGFSTLVRMDAQGGSQQAYAGCYDRGAICAPGSTQN